MTTPKALEIAHEASKSRNYGKVATRLKKEYNKPEQIYKCYQNQFLELKAVKDDHDSLGSFRQSIQKHLDGFQMNKGYTADHFGLRTSCSLTDWLEQAEVVTPPLLAFLSKRVNATQEDEPVENQAYTRPILSNKPSAKKKETRQGRILHAQDCTTYLLLLPTSALHLLVSYLNGQSVEQRNESVRQKRLCFNCLSAEVTVLANVSGSADENIIQCSTNSQLHLLLQQRIQQLQYYDQSRTLLLTLCFSRLC